MLTWVGWVLWAFTASSGLSIAWGCRRNANTQRGFHPGTAVIAFYFCAVAALFLLMPWNKLHLAWLIPVGYLAGPLATFRVVPLVSPILLTLSRLFIGLVLLGKRTWLTMLPNHLRPSQYDALETVRRKYRIGHRDFSMHISGHPMTTRNLQRANFDQLKTLRPDLTDEALMHELVKARRVSSWRAGMDFFGLVPDMSEATVRQKEAELIWFHPTPDSFAAALTDQDAPWDVPSSPEMVPAAREVTAILEQDHVVLI
jgi:hypothetical protein